jgi:hypothetical protein
MDGKIRILEIWLRRTAKPAVLSRPVPPGLAQGGGVQLDLWLRGRLNAQ